MLLDVISVSTQPDFKLNLTFQNGEQRCFDMNPLLSIKPWNRISDASLFNKVRVDYGTLVWPGEINIAPETLYDDSIPIQSI